MLKILPIATIVSIIALAVSVAGTWSFSQQRIAKVETSLAAAKDAQIASEGRFKEDLARLERSQETDMARLEREAVKIEQRVGERLSSIEAKTDRMSEKVDQILRSILSQGVPPSGKD